MPVFVLTPRRMFADDFSSYRASKLVDVPALNMQWRE
jgi:hypothetical protein